MTSLDTFRNSWLPQERRSVLDRRIVRERRQVFSAVGVERRHPGRRRAGVDRRESPAGHIRNALQILHVLGGQLSMEGDQKERFESSMRRLWLALAEAERRRRQP